MHIEAKQLYGTIAQTYEAYGGTTDTELQLPLAVLQPLQQKLIGSLAFPTPKIKVRFKKTEALAFHNLYMCGIIATNFITAHINTDIHKTL